MSITAAIVLAAGQGKRMKSDLPKVLHRICGKPMIAHILTAVGETGFTPVVVVVGHAAEQVRAACPPGTTFAEQPRPLGTGDAVGRALDVLPDVDEVVVIYGDYPLVRPQTLEAMVSVNREWGAAMTIATNEAADPTGLGRVIADGDRIVAIVEEVDATPEQRAIRRVNSGVYCFEGGWLRRALARLRPSPRGELYLTDLVALAVGEGRRVAAVDGDSLEVIGINDRAQLAEAEAAMRSRINRRLMLSGVTIADPATTYVDADVLVGRDTTIQPNTHLSGRTAIGERCVIGPNSQVIDSTIGRGCVVWASVVESSSVGDGTRIGPFSHLRSGTRLASGVEVGNFAETKEATVGEGTKVHHFSYIGDAELGRDVNVGAGTITCNYDREAGAKHRTTVGDGASLGSDTLLVAPVRVGAGAMTGAGAVVTHDVDPADLVVGVPAKRLRRVRRAPAGSTDRGGSAASSKESASSPGLE